MIVEPAHPGACHVLLVDPQKRVEAIVLETGVHLIVVQDEVDVGRIEHRPNFWPS